MNEKRSCVYAGSAFEWVKCLMSSERTADFERHLATCPSCQDEERHARILVLLEKGRETELWAELTV